MNSFVLTNLFKESQELRKNFKYLCSLRWEQHNEYFVSLSEILDEGKIRKFKKKEIIDGYNEICSSIITPYAEKIKGLLQYNIEYVMRTHPVYILKDREGISILEGRHRVGAAFISNALSRKIDILKSIAYLNCYVGTEV